MKEEQKKRPDVCVALNISPEREKLLQQRAAHIIANRYFRVLDGDKDPIPEDYGYGDKVNCMLALQREIEYDPSNRENEIIFVSFVAGAFMTSEEAMMQMMARDLFAALDDPKQNFPLFNKPDSNEE
jgi:hypothetical protein